MRPSEIAALFVGDNANKEAEEYLKSEGCPSFLYSQEGQKTRRFMPNVADLARLHKVVRSRKVITSLEFGTGYSTTAISLAIRANQNEWLENGNNPDFRREALFQHHTIDTSADWLDIVKKETELHGYENISFHHSKIVDGTFHDRSVLYYETLPHISPDFIYIDGPDPQDAMSGPWSCKDVTVIAADVLKMESYLLPGTLILIDGRSANARFIRKHLYRDWVAVGDEDSNIFVFELCEAPLGPRSAIQMEYCLGKQFFDDMSKKLQI